MVRGQELDLAYEAVPASEAQLCEVHRNKTGMLIAAAAQLGAVASGASQAQQDALRQFAFSVGLVFQMVDDVLDVVSTTQELGKPVGSDAQNGKTTFVTLHGVEGTRAPGRRAQRPRHAACWHPLLMRMRAFCAPLHKALFPAQHKKGVLCKI